MKLAYVNIKPSLGVFQKIKGQAAAAKKINVDIDFFVLSDCIPSEDPDVSVCRLNYPKMWLFRRIAENFFCYDFINKAIDFRAYDKIILRYPSSIALRYRFFFRKYKNKIILEHHSDLIEELKVIEKGFLNPLRIFLERYNSPRLHSQAAGIIGVTDELRMRYCRLVPFRKIPSCVISNGIDVEQVPFTKFNPTNKDTVLNLIFVSSTFYPWHGLDRLLEGLVLYQGIVKIKLVIIGIVEGKKESELIRNFSHNNVQIEIMDPLIGSRLDDIYCESHLAVSSLAIFRNNMKEACVLKTREYTARGIPFIYAYNDVDLDDPCEFALKMECSDCPIDIASVVEFAFQTAKKENLSDKMRKYALERMDWKRKIQEIHRFAENLNEKDENP